MKTKLIICLIIFLTSCSETVKYKSIDLSNLQLVSIPDSIFSKNDITDLNLGTNDFVIYPPLSGLGPMNKDSSLNHLTELDERIGNLTNLKTLNISGNRLKQLPESITKLTNLEELNLAFNDELDVSTEIDKLQRMKSLKILGIMETKNINSNYNAIKKILEPRMKVIYSFMQEADTTKLRLQMDSIMNKMNSELKNRH